MQFDEKKVLEIIAKHGEESSATIPILQEVQSVFGYLPNEVMEFITQHTAITPTQIYGVATFYSQFHLNPRGKHIIKVCHGTACHVGGAEKIGSSMKSELKLAEGEETTSDGEFTVEDVACLGCCSLAPVIMIDETAHGRLNSKEIPKIIKQYSK
jgi:NADH:ubiquinone oxidoreductase subunit E